MILTGKHDFALKGSVRIEFYLGFDFVRDADRTLCMAPQHYIECMVNPYEQTFACNPKTNFTAPLKKNEHPEIDDSELLDAAGIQKYQSLIGSLRCAVSLGRLDVETSVMTLSSFCSKSCGQLEHAK